MHKDVEQEFIQPTGPYKHNIARRVWIFLRVYDGK